MTKRGKELNMLGEYKQALSDAEKLKPEGLVYIIHSENGSQVGRVIYKSDEDILSIDIGGSTIVNIKGEYLKSISHALNDIFSEAE